MVLSWVRYFTAPLRALSPVGSLLVTISSCSAKKSWNDERSLTLQEAERVLDGHDLEVWDGPRFIKKLKSKAKSESVMARLRALLHPPQK